ncbi:MAG: DUF3524 domain-containing protein [Kiritimatiellae bacterium]|nr:DUF3524 domain-containing protein [Kiritimatiellia bacterium]
MKILALEPYCGGSHQAFLDGWIEHSRHEWTVLGLPPNKWKWRMRHAAVTFSKDTAERSAAGERWDRVFCSDMLNLAEFLGLAHEALRRVPTIAYFHENQLTYPYQYPDERDYQFVFTNITTALAASAVWFNSEFHRSAFLAAIPDFLKRMPDCHPLHVADQIRAKSDIRPQGIRPVPPPAAHRRPGPMRIVWAARWEHDKNPDEFFAALDQLETRGVDFELSVIGQRFRQTPDSFDRAHTRFAGRIRRWGYQASRADYLAALAEADVAVSTAAHEFFGISIAEAAAAGAYPLVPRRLAYPEVLGLDEDPAREGFFYEDGPAALAARLAELADRVARDDLWQGRPDLARAAVTRFLWPNLAPELDRAAEAVAGR